MSRRKIKILIVAGQIFFLIIIRVISLFSNQNPDDELQISQNKEVTPDFYKTEIKKLSEEEAKQIIPSLIDSTLQTFGIKKEWIKEVTQGDPVILFSKQVDIPSDLSALQVQFEIEKCIYRYSISASSKEEFPEPNLYSDFFRDKNGTPVPIGKIEYKKNPDKSFTRESADICFVIKGIENYEKKYIDQLLNTRFKLTFMFPNNLEKSDVQSLIIDSKKDYLLMFDIGEAEDFASDFRRDKDWKTKVYAVCGDYDKDVPIVFNNPKKLFEFENDLINELLKCKNRNVFKDTVFRKIKSTANSGAVDLVSMDIKMKTEKKIRKIIYLLELNKDELEYFLRECSRIERKGYKVKSFSSVMKY